MVHISAYIRDPSVLHKVDELVDKGYFRTRSHAIEFALRKLVIDIEKQEIRF